MIVGTFLRRSSSEKLGIGLQQINGNLVITSLPETGIVGSQTNLKVGHRVRMINNVDCTDKTGKDAIQYLFAGGYVTILAEDHLPNDSVTPDSVLFEPNMVTCVAWRDSTDMKLGIGIRKVDGELVISSLNENGILASLKTNLRVGYRMMMIDEMNCANLSTEEVVQFLRERSLGGPVTIVAMPSGAYNAVPVTPALVKAPPPGCGAGGTWGTSNHVGPITCAGCLLVFLCTGIPLVCVVCCPCDVQEAYQINETIYSADGTYLGKAANANFAPCKTAMQRS